MTTKPKAEIDATAWLRQQKEQAAKNHSISVSAREAATAEVQHWLESLGVAYAPATWISVDLINTKASRNNQARRNALEMDNVERFTEALKDGAEFPPIVCYRLGELLVIIDGNHRHESTLRAKRDKIWGIVIDSATPSQVISRLTIDANIRHGETPGKEWRVEQALYMMTLGYTVQQAAEATLVKTSDIGQARKVEDFNQHVRDLGVPEAASKVNPTVKLRLLPLRRERDVFLEMLRLCLDIRMTVDQVDGVLRDMRQYNSEAERLGCIARARAERETITVANVGLSRRNVSSSQKFASSMGLLANVNAGELVRGIRTDGDYRKYKEHVESALSKLGELEEALNSFQLGDDE